MIFRSGRISQAMAREGGVGSHLMLPVLLTLLACNQGGPPVTPSRAEGGLRELRRTRLVTSDSAMVVSASPYATEAGLAVLRNGGNAIDAAVAVAFTLAVTYPTAGNIGGGGFLVARLNRQTSPSIFRRQPPAARRGTCISTAPVSSPTGVSRAHSPQEFPDRWRVSSRRTTSAARSRGQS